MGLTELTIRDWMVIVGVILIMAVLLDAWRRIRRDKHNKVRMKLVDPEDLPPAASDGIGWFGELPNGGARVVERGDILRAAGFGSNPDKTAAKNKAAEKAASKAAAKKSAVKSTRNPAPEKPQDDEELLSGMSSLSAVDEGENLDWLDGLVSDDDHAPTAPAEPGEGKLPRGEQPEVFMLNVVARDAQGFHGDDILQILLACDLRFGDMNFFHRHEFEAGRGAIQFSVANMMQPGVFDIDNMGDMNTPGLVFFLTLPGPEDMMKAFDYMLETAQAVARNLGADVLDESRSALTKQSMEHSRQKIRELERRLLAKAR
ncbi:MAG: cell division protein ZipA [Halioglobus sp.]